MTPVLMILGDPDRYRNYQAAVTAAGGKICFSANPAPAGGCHGLLLPGGGDLEPWRYGQDNTASRDLEPERDALELALMERFTAAGKPILGICRGMQTINVFFGGTLCQEVPGHSALGKIDRLHTVHTAASPLDALYGRCAVVNSAHHQAADRLGSGLRAVQWTADGVAEALCHETLPVWAVQWHPERLRGAGRADGQRLFQAFLALCRESENFAKSGRETDFHA